MILCYWRWRCGHLLSLTLLACGTLAAQTASPAADLPAVARKVVLPQGWALTREAPAAAEFIHAPGIPAGGQPTAAQMQNADARIDVSIRHIADRAHIAAVLAEFASEGNGKVLVRALRGWPSVSWTFRAPPPRTGDPAQADEALGGVQLATYTRTAVAVNLDVIRFSSAFAPSAAARLVAEAEAIVEATVDGAGASIPHPGSQEIKLTLANVRAAIASLRTHALTPSALHVAIPLAETIAPVPVQPTLVLNGEGELEVAVSDDGMRILVAANAGLAISRDGGQSFAEVPVAASPGHCVGDPSVGIGASGRFYYSWMPFGSQAPAPPGGSPPESRVSVAVSTADAQSLQYRSDAATCPGGVCDQPHLAADRFHAAPSGADRIYVVWRNFKDRTQKLPPVPTITCSADGASTWLPARQIYDSSGDFPRLTVAPDGTAFVTFVAGQAIKLAKYSSCDSGLQTQNGFPATVATYQDVVCPIPGLDRCNSGNVLGSPTVAVDETNANHVYVAWATSTKSGKNEDILVADSVDGGSTFRPPVRVNNAVTGRRFMPWIVADGNSAYVNWYDRRFAGKAENDLTRYFGAVITTGSDGALAARETDISMANEQQCANLWPVAPRSDSDSKSCSLQPEMAGRCHGTNVPCDFKRFCSGGRQCELGEGLPKFGDYNGIAARNGRRYSVWSSTRTPANTNPPDLNDSTNAKRLHIYLVIDRIR
jgi:hypothetical protein